MSKKREALGQGINALFDTYDKKVNSVAERPKWILKGKDGHQYTTAPVLGQFIVEHTKLKYFQRGIKEELRIYDSENGYWKPEPQQQVDKLVTKYLNMINDWSSRKMKDTTTFILSSIDAVDASKTIDDVVDKDKVIFKNGVYSFEEDKMLDHSPNYYFPTGRNYSIKTEIQATPTIDKWLTESVGKDGYKLLKQYIGYMFYRTNETWQSWIILLAEGGDGKSTFFNWLNEIVGDDNTSAVSIENLTSAKNRFGLADLIGKSLNYDADITNDHIQKPALLKKITGNDRVDIEKKGKDSYKVHLYAKLMFGANDLPTFSDNSKGFKRRAIIMPFHKIDDFNQRYSLKEIYREIPSFTYKCLRVFWKTHNQQELEPSQNMKKIRDNWIGANNHVVEFVDDYCEIKAGYREKKVYVYRAYKEFCNENGYKPLSNVQFKKELERLELTPKIIDKVAKIKGKPYKCYVNIKLNSSMIVNETA